MPLATAALTWYVARSGGILAYVLLTVAVVLGLTMSGRVRSQRWPRFAVGEVHRFVGLLAGTFVGIHVLALLLDGYMPFSVVQLVVPGASTYRPLATALGVVSAELLVALAVTNRFRKRISYRVWRRAHFLNFAVWTLGLAHGVFAGTDRGTAWAAGLYGASATCVASLVVWRALRTGRIALPQPQRSTT